MLTRKVKTVIKDWRLEFINRSQSKEIIKIATKQEPYIKVQESIMDKMHIYHTIE